MKFTVYGYFRVALGFDIEAETKEEAKEKAEELKFWWDVSSHDGKDVEVYDDGNSLQNIEVEEVNND